MSRDTKKQIESTEQTSDSLQLPEIPDCLQAALGRGHTLPIEGTNVLRVPFGIRQARRQRPERPDGRVAAAPRHTERKPAKVRRPCVVTASEAVP